MQSVEQVLSFAGSSCPPDFSWAPTCVLVFAKNEFVCDVPCPFAGTVLEATKSSWSRITSYHSSLVAINTSQALEGASIFLMGPDGQNLLRTKDGWMDL